MQELYFNVGKNPATLLKLSNFIFEILLKMTIKKHPLCLLTKGMFH